MASVVLEVLGATGWWFGADSSCQGAPCPQPLSVTRSQLESGRVVQKESLVESAGGLGDSEAESQLGRLSPERKRG